MSRQSGWNQYYHQGQGYDTRGAGVEEKGFEDTKNSGNKEALESETDEDYARRLYREDREEMDRQLRNKYGQPGDGAYYNTSDAPGGYASGPQAEQYGSGIPPQAPQIQFQPQPRTYWRPYFTYLVTLVQTVLLIYSFIYNQNLTGSALQTNPFNPMIGPGANTLVQLGARFVPCMRNVAGFNDTTQISCPTSTGGTTTCNLETLCGLGGFHGGGPDQWDRFIIPIFLHAGVIHYIFNMVFQLTTGKQVENELGFLRYGIIYMASGTFGFIFGGNFAAPAIPSMGASGSLFGIVGVLLVEILQNWKRIPNPCWELTKLLVMIIISFLLGLLPGLDNFSHIGGFLMGVTTGLALNTTYNFSKIHRFANIILRIIAVGISALLFYLLIQNFYAGDPNEKCPWCKYLSCLPFTGWCDSKIGNSTTN